MDQLIQLVHYPEHSTFSSKAGLLKELPRIILTTEKFHLRRRLEPSFPTSKYNAILLYAMLTTIDITVINMHSVLIFIRFFF